MAPRSNANPEFTIIGTDYMKKITNQSTNKSIYLKQLS